MYCLPSASQKCGPAARSMNRGVPPTERNARTGEFTPPGMVFWARSKRASFLDMTGPALDDGFCLRGLRPRVLSSFDNAPDDDGARFSGCRNQAEIVPESPGSGRKARAYRGRRRDSPQAGAYNAYTFKASFKSFFRPPNPFPTFLFVSHARNHQAPFRSPADSFAWRVGGLRSAFHRYVSAEPAVSRRCIRHDSRRRADHADQ